MTNAEIEQRIRYLVEHGGVYEDPHEDIRRTVSVTRAISLIALLLVAVHLVIELARV